jgi:hypothetical protein
MAELVSCWVRAGFNNNGIRGGTMVRTRVAAVLAAASFFAVHLTAMAAPVHYNIQFSGSTVSSTLPTGSFDYDPTTPAFSNFVVEWNGRSFDLTGGANSPTVFVSNVAGAPVCGATSGAEKSFLLLSKDSCLPQELAPKEWELFPLGSDSLHFDFVGGGGEAEMFFTSSFVDYANECQPDCGSGSWEISRAIPEPGTLALLGFGLAGLAASRRRRQ